MRGQAKKEKKQFRHSEGVGFKEQLEEIFRRYRAGLVAKDLLDSGNYGKGAVYVPTYCLAVSPHVKGRTKRTRIEPLFYPYEFINNSDTVYFEPGTTVVRWKLPKIHDTILVGQYRVTVGDVKRKPKQASYTIEQGDDKSWSENINLQLQAHRNNPDFERIPANIHLKVKSKKEVEKLLEFLVKDMKYVRNEVFPALTKQWSEDIVKKIPIPENLRETWDRQDSLQEMNAILLDGLEKFSSPERPRTTWTKWIMLYGKRGVQRKIDALTQESHDVNRVMRFASHYPDVSDAEELRRLWVIKNELRDLKVQYPHLSEVELTAIVDVDIEKCSVSLENFKKALEGSDRKISISTPASSESESFTLADRISSKVNVEDEIENKRQLENFVVDLLSGSNLDANKIMSSIERTSTGFKMDAKTKQLLFSPWLEEGESWSNKLDKQKAMTRAHSDLTVNGGLRSTDRIEKIWNSNKVTDNKKTIRMDLSDSLSSEMHKAIVQTNFDLLKACYILSMTGYLTDNKISDKNLLPALSEILKYYKYDKVAPPLCFEKAKSTLFAKELFMIPADYNLTLDGYSMIIDSPLDLKSTLKNLVELGVIGYSPDVSRVKITKISKILKNWVVLDKNVDEVALTQLGASLREKAVRR